MSEKKRYACGWCGRSGWGSKESRPENWTTITMENPAIRPEVNDLCDIACVQAWLESRGVKLRGAAFGA